MRFDPKALMSATSLLFLTGTGEAQLIGGPIINPGNGHAYFILDAGTWTALENESVTLGGHLATINDQAEQDFVWTQFGQFGGVDRHLWIGLSDAAIEGTYVWSSGEPLTYTNWGPGEPNHAFPSEDFVHMQHGSFDGRWQDRRENEGTTVYGVAEIPLAAFPYCFGDGSGTACPCSNAGDAGHGCANGTFQSGSELTATGSASVGADTLVLEVFGSTPGQSGLFFQGDDAVNGGMGFTFGDGLRCAGGNVVRLQVRVADGTGSSATTISIAATASLSPGDLKRYQWWYRDPTLSPCLTGFNLSNGVEVTWAP